MIRVVATDLYAALAQASGLDFTPNNVHGRCLEYDTDSGAAHLHFLFDTSGALLSIHAEAQPVFCDCQTPDEVADARRERDAARDEARDAQAQVARLEERIDELEAEAEETAATLAALRQSAALGEALALTGDPEEVALLRQTLALLRRRSGGAS